MTLYLRNVPDQPPLWPDDEPYLRYVVKLHQATTLHYDFRLEAFGALISWILPRQPSCDPSRALWARQVGDHDPRWLLTERRIPQGYSGAGPMLVWDHGLFRPVVDHEGSHSLAVCKALRRGWLDFELFGERLRGLYRIQRFGEDWRLR